MNNEIQSIASVIVLSGLRKLLYLEEHLLTIDIYNQNMSMFIVRTSSGPQQLARDVIQKGGSREETERTLSPSQCSVPC